MRSYEFEILDKGVNYVFIGNEHNHSDFKFQYF